MTGIRARRLPKAAPREDHIGDTTKMEGPNIQNVLPPCGCTHAALVHGNLDDGRLGGCMAIGCTCRKFHLPDLTESKRAAKMAVEEKENARDPGDLYPLRKRGRPRRQPVSRVQN